MSDQPLIYEKDYANKRALITFNRPERMNAMSPELLALLREASEDFSNDPQLWVAIVTGAGERAFCAGADLSSTIPQRAAATRSEPLKVEETRSLHGISKPVLAAVNGYCIAGGLEFMLGTDIRVAAEHAEFGLQGSALGKSCRRAARTSACRARSPGPGRWRSCSPARRLSAREALQCGLINRVVPREQLLPTAHAIADLICANGPLAVRTAKEIAVRGAMGMSWEQGLGDGVIARGPCVRQRGRDRRPQGFYGEARAAVQGPLAAAVDRPEYPSISIGAAGLGRQTDGRGHGLRRGGHWKQASVRALRRASTGSRCTCSRRAGRSAQGAPSARCCCCCTASPELAYSWRKVMLPLAEAGYHVAAPDQRGYGRTSGWDGSYDGDLRAYGMLNLVRDAMGLVAALGRDSAAAVIGHDFGSPVAAYAALIRPDIFRSAVMRSGPFSGPPPLPAGEYRGSGAAGSAAIQADLAALDRPRKHYQSYYCTPARRRRHARRPAGRARLSARLLPHEERRLAAEPAASACGLERRRAGQAAQLLRECSWQTTCRPRSPARCRAPQRLPPASGCRTMSWPSTRRSSAATAFRGGLQWYRAARDPAAAAQLQLFSGRRVDAPTCFIAGASDWGVYQSPGALERMQQQACTQMLDCSLVEGAGHWVQQEQPAGRHRAAASVSRASRGPRLGARLGPVPLPDTDAEKSGGPGFPGAAAGLPFP